MITAIQVRDCIPDGMATLKPTNILKNTFRQVSLCELFLLPVVQMLDSTIHQINHYPLPTR